MEALCSQKLKKYQFVIYINNLQLNNSATMTQPIILEQQWMKLMGPTISCSVIHPHSSCTFQILSKCLQVVKNSSKLYALLYFAMFAVQFKKIYRQRKIRKTILNWTQDYVWSLCFMSWIVGGMKSIICLLNNLGVQLDGSVTPLLSFGASPALYFLQKSRRPEVALFTFVRCCRSIYIYVTKRMKVKISSQKQLSFIFLYGFLSFMYFEKPDCLKNKNILQSLWGQF